MVPATSRPGRSEAPGGGAYFPSRCRTSGRFTPAAATAMSTSPGAATGRGRSTRRRPSAGPGVPISTARIGLVPQVRGQSRRRQQPGEDSPPLRGIVAGAPLDVGPGHVLAEVVVDDVAAVGVEELHPLRRLRRRVHRVAHQPVGRPRRVHAAVEIAACRLVAGIGQRLGQRQDVVVLVDPGRVETGQRKQRLALEGPPLGVAEGHLDAVVRRALGDQRLRREERVDRELDPAAVPHQVLLEQHVVDVMARVALVTRQIDGPVDEHRQVGVDLDEALVAALVPVVGAPRLVLDVGHGEGLARRQGDVRKRPAPALGDGGRGRRRRAGPAGITKRLPEGRVAGRQLAAAADTSADGIDGLLERCLGVAAAPPRRRARGTPRRTDTACPAACSRARAARSAGAPGRPGAVRRISASGVAASIAGSRRRSTSSTAARLLMSASVHSACSTS